MLVTVMFQNGLGPGPLQNVKMKHFKQAEYVESTKRWMVIVDEHKTTQHQVPAELAMDKQLFQYTQLYIDHIRPCLVASREDHIFIKDDGHAFRKGTICRHLQEVFERAGVHLDVSLTATKTRKLYSSSAVEMPLTKKATSSFKWPKSIAFTEWKSKPSDTDSDEDVPLRDLFEKPYDIDHATTAVEDDPRLDALDKVVITSVFRQKN